MHPWGDGAGDMRIALFGVVVGDGSGGEAHAAAVWRCAALDHFRHGCTGVRSREREVVTPEEAGGRAVRCVEWRGLAFSPFANLLRLTRKVWLVNWLPNLAGDWPLRLNDVPLSPQSRRNDLK